MTGRLDTGRQPSHLPAVLVLGCVPWALSPPASGGPTAVATQPRTCSLSPSLLWALGGRRSARVWPAVLLESCSHCPRAGPLLVCERERGPDSFWKRGQDARPARTPEPRLLPDRAMRLSLQGDRACLTPTGPLQILPLQTLQACPPPFTTHFGVQPAAPARPRLPQGRLAPGASVWAGSLGVSSRLGEAGLPGL